MNKEDDMNINEKRKEMKRLVNLNHSGVNEFEEIESVFVSLEEKGTTFIEEIHTKQMVLDVFRKDIYMDCESRVLYSLKESIDYIDKEKEFDEFRKGLTVIFRDMLNIWKNYDVKIDPYLALRLINDFTFDVFKRILKYNMYRLHLIMAEYKTLNILFPINFNTIREDEFDENFKKKR